MNKKISYVTLISDLYILLGLSYIIYGIFFNFERIGNSSLVINTDKNIAILIAFIEVMFSFIIAYLLHKCNYKIIRIILIIITILNIIYRIINILFVINPFTLLMIVINVVLFIILLSY